MKKANLLRALYFLVFCCTASWLPVLADFCISKGLTGVQTSLVLSITPLMMFLVQPLYGLLADNFGYKKILLLSSAFATIAYLAYLIDGSFAWLIIITIIMSVFYNTIQPLLDSLSLELSDEDPAFSYGTLRIAGAIGWSFTGIITGKVIDGMHINMIFIIAAMSMAGVFLLSLFLKDNRPTSKSSGSLFKGAKELIENKSLLFLLVSVVLISIAGTSIWNFYSLYMKGNGASASLVGYGLSLQGLCELPFFYFSAKIILRLGIKKTLVITVFALALRLSLYGLVYVPKWALPIEVLHGLSWSLFWVACVEYVNGLIDKKWMVAGQSLLYAAYYGLGAIAGNYWTGFLSDKHLPYGEIFFINGAIIFIVAILLVIFLRTNPQN
jgi:PPP family 3-phenylpropionic acid transporter